MFGRNIAWSYTNADAVCGGNINLAYWPHWAVLGCLLEGGGLDALGRLVAAAAAAAGGAGPPLALALAVAAAATPMRCVVDRASALAGRPDDVWAACLTAEGVNRELGPLVSMSSPTAELIDAAAIAAALRRSGGAPVLLARSVVSLCGLPIDVDHVTIAEFDAGARRFLERSPMLSVRGLWEHERRVMPAAAGGGCTVHDTLRFTPRLGLLAPLVWAFVYVLFRHRHRRLATRWGPGTCVA